MTKDLYTTNDIKLVREMLLNEQNGLDLLTGLPIPENSRVLDHCHNDEQLVRGVLHRQSNVVLGKIENLWGRYLSYWYPNDLQTFLRQAADYLERPPDKRYRHPNFQKKLKVWYNGLTSKQQNEVLLELGSVEGPNAVVRKELFSKIVLDKGQNYDMIRSVINKVKGE